MPCRSSAVTATPPISGASDGDEHDQCRRRDPGHDGPSDAPHDACIEERSLEPARPQRSRGRGQRDFPHSCMPTSSLLNTRAPEINTRAPEIIAEATAWTT